MPLPKFNIFDPKTGASRNTDRREDALPGEIVIEREQRSQEARLVLLEARIARLEKLLKIAGTP